MNPLRALFLSLSRMPPGVMLVAIIGLAIVVTMMVTGTIGSEKRAADEQRAALEAKYNQKATVVYSTRDIPEGATISSDALQEQQVEVGRAPVDALPSAALAVGRIAKYGIPAGQIVSQHDMSPMGISVGFEAKVKGGMRAVTFAVDANSGVAGFVTPGSHVDIIATAGSGYQTKAQPILSDVEVVAVGSQYQKTSGAAAAAIPATSVTVSVAPSDAEKLIKGIVAGKLYLTLRNDKDHTPVAVVDTNNLFDKPKSEMAALPPPTMLPPPPPLSITKLPPPLREVELWSGSSKEVLSVPNK